MKRMMNLIAGLASALAVYWLIGQFAPGGVQGMLAGKKLLSQIAVVALTVVPVVTALVTGIGRTGDSLIGHLFVPFLGGLLGGIAVCAVLLLIRGVIWFFTSDAWLVVILIPVICAAVGDYLTEDRRPRVGQKPDYVIEGSDGKLHEVYDLKR